MPDGTPEIAIVGVVSKLLSDLVARNDQLPLAPTQVTPFHSSKPPSISVRSYLEDRCAAPHLPAPCRASSPHALDWQHPQVCRVLGRDIHPGADLHGPGRSVQPRICHLVAQRASAPDHGDHAREQGACRRQPRAPPPRLSRRALARAVLRRRVLQQRLLCPRRRHLQHRGAPPPFTAALVPPRPGGDAALVR